MNDLSNYTKQSSALEKIIDEQIAITREVNERLRRLIASNGTLKSDNKDLSRSNERLATRFCELREENRALEKENKTLKAKLSLMEEISGIKIVIGDAGLSLSSSAIFDMLH